jgi:hypothetical protein
VVPIAAIGSKAYFPADVPDCCQEHGQLRTKDDGPGTSPQRTATPGQLAVRLSRRPAARACPGLIRRRSLGTILGAVRPNDFPARRTSTDKSMAIMPACGQVRTTLNGLTGIYGSEGPHILRGRRQSYSSSQGGQGCGQVT